MNDLKKKWWVVDGDDACKDEVSRLDQNISIETIRCHLKLSLSKVFPRCSMLQLFMSFYSYFFLFRAVVVIRCPWQPLLDFL